jgi:hypothetical protein
MLSMMNINRNAKIIRLAAENGLSTAEKFFPKNTSKEENNKSESMRNKVVKSYVNYIFILFIPKHFSAAVLIEFSAH